MDAIWRISCTSDSEQIQCYCKVILFIAGVPIKCTNFYVTFDWNHVGTYIVSTYVSCHHVLAGIRISSSVKQKGVNPISDNASFSLEHYVTYCCLIFGPAALGHYSDLRPSTSERAWNSFKKMYSLKHDEIGLTPFCLSYPLMLTKFTGQINILLPRDLSEREARPTEPSVILQTILAITPNDV